MRDGWSVTQHPPHPSDDRRKSLPPSPARSTRGKGLNVRTIRPPPLPTVFASLSPAGNFLIFTDNPPAAAAKPNPPLCHRARTMCVKYLKDMRREREPGVIDMDLKTRPHGDRGCARLGWIGFETMGGRRVREHRKRVSGIPHPRPQHQKTCLVLASASAASQASHERN